MTLSRLNAEHLYQALLAGCQAIVKEREALNAINIFPVQDGDTGDNMAATASAVINHASLESSIKETLQSIANASMTGARGNSGMIFSQFFNALADHANEEETLSLHHFGELLKNAAQRVRAAIMNPMDGTMLTIMERWSSYTQELASNQTACFKTSLQSITHKLQDAVSQTTQALAVLKAANVVDAGALGFFHFVNGFSQCIADPTSIQIEHVPLEDLIIEHIDFCGSEPPVDGRFCTEAMIVGDHIQQEQLMDHLKNFGHSIVVSANEKQCRFHIHTNEPWNVFDSIASYGKIHQPKVDDMMRQYEAINVKRHSVAIVTDSNVDLPWETLEKHQIHILPLNVHLEDNDLLDRYTIQPESFYQNFQEFKTHPKTSCPSVMALEHKLKPLAQCYDEVLILSIAQSLSSTHDTLKHIADKYPNMHVLNTKRCSAAQGLLVEEAAHMLDQGLDAAAIQQRLEHLIPKTTFWFMAQNLNALVRSGRVHKIIGKMAFLSGLKPYFSLASDGKAQLTGQAFSEVKALQKVLEQVQQRIRAGEKLKKYAIIHAGATELANKLAKMAFESFGLAPSYTEYLSVTVGVHAGAGCVGIAAMFE